VRSILKFKNKKRFVINRHFSRKAGIHFDLRLELNNILESWASKNIDELVKDSRRKVLLIKTKDHPLKWLNIEGHLNEDYYDIFDKGTYNIIKKTSNLMELRFNGKKLKGVYILLKKEKNKYLFFKK